MSLRCSHFCLFPFLWFWFLVFKVATSKQRLTQGYSGSFCVEYTFLWSQNIVHHERLERYHGSFCNGQAERILEMGILTCGIDGFKWIYVVQLIVSWQSNSKMPLEGFWRRDPPQTCICLTQLVKHLLNDSCSILHHLHLVSSFSRL